MAPVELDTIQRAIGAYGRFQFWLTCVIFVIKISMAYYMISIVFLAPGANYYCDNDTTKKNVCPCKHPTYDRSVFTDTIVMKWNLICKRKWLISLTQSLFQFGTLIGSVIFGTASDRFGRRPPLLIAITMQFVFALATVYAPTYWLFSLLRFLVGMSVGGTMVISFVLLMEFCGSQHREVIASLYQFPFNLGHMLLPAISYFLRDYVDFQLALLSSAIILLPYFFILPETPRWLLAAKRTEAGIQCIERVARINKLPTQNIRTNILAYQAEVEQKKHLKKGTMLDLFRTPNIRKNIICMAMNWMACSYCFYGVSQYVSHLTGNIFINVFASACFAFLGSVLSIPLQIFMGRKTILISQNFVCVACLLLLCAFPEEPYISIFLAVIGVMASFTIFVVVYPYCGELFPTVVRNAAMGFSSMMARVGSVLAPFVIDTKDISERAPPFLFAVFPLIAGCLTFLMPETKGHELMTTLEEAEEFGKRKPPVLPNASHSISESSKSISASSKSISASSKSATSEASATSDQSIPPTNSKPR